VSKSEVLEEGEGRARPDDTESINSPFSQGRVLALAGKFLLRTSEDTSKRAEVFFVAADQDAYQAVEGNKAWNV
jgi:hypothetical protein